MGSELKKMMMFLLSSGIIFNESRGSDDQINKL